MALQLPLQFPLPWAIVFLPWLGALLLAALPRGTHRGAGQYRRLGGWPSCLALFLFGHPGGEQGWTRVDALNTPLVVLSFLIGLTTAVFSLGAIAAERFDALRLRAYHVAFQVFMGAQALALLSDNMGVMWVAIEIATMASVLIVAVHGTPAAIEAAWKLFILCGVGITLALFGTIVLYLAAQPFVGHGDSGLSWVCCAASRRMRPRRAEPRLRLPAGRLRHQGRAGAAAFLAAGCRGGGADRHVRGAVRPAAERRAACGAAGQGDRRRASRHRAAGLFPGGARPCLRAAGGFALWRRRDARRFFAWSSIEHMGLAAIAFGLGGHDRQPGGAAAHARAFADANPRCSSASAMRRS